MCCHNLSLQMLPDVFIHASNFNDIQLATKESDSIMIFVLHLLSQNHLTSTSTFI